MQKLDTLKKFDKDKIEKFVFFFGFLAKLA